MTQRAMTGAGTLAVWCVYATVVAATGLPAETALAVTAEEVTAACSPCHGLTVNGVVVSPGPGSFGFSSTVNGRGETAWARSINRMVRLGAEVSDVDGTAAYLAGLGAPICEGDCDEDGTVTVDEILDLVNIALDRSPLSACERADVNGSGTITVDEILAGVANALTGCPLP